MLTYRSKLNKCRAQFIEEQARLSEKKRLQLAKDAVDYFEANQLCFNELMHYREEKEILGIHPIFENEMLDEEIKLLTKFEALKMYKNLASKISREKKKLSKAKTQKSQKAIQLVIDRAEKKRKKLKAKIDE